MAHPRGPTKIEFLKKLKAFVTAAYEGNLGENRRFTVEISSDGVGDIAVKYHECESSESDDDVQVSNEGNKSAWK